MKRRKSDSPQKAALRELMTEYLKSNDITVKKGTDDNDIMRDMMSIILEGTVTVQYLRMQYIKQLIRKSLHMLYLT